MPDSEAHVYARRLLGEEWIKATTIIASLTPE